MYLLFRNLLTPMIFFMMVSIAQANAACIRDGKTITGTLRLVKIQYTRTRALDRFVLDRRRRTCVVVNKAGRNRRKTVDRIVLKIRNAKSYELKKLVGLRIAVRGTFKDANGRNKRYEAQLNRATLIGSYDPRNNKFYNWQYLSKRIARMSVDRTFEPEEYEYVRKDTSALTKLIRQTIPEYAKERDEEEEMMRDTPSRITRNSIKDQLLGFIIDDFLRFPSMHPSDVVEFYAPTLNYNGDVYLPRERVVQIKFSRFRQNHQSSMELIKRSVQIERNRDYANSYNVRFQYRAKGGHSHPPRWVKRTAELLIDVDMSTLQILAETTDHY